jgi:hypothetical protein
MKFEDAVLKSVKLFLDGKMPTKTAELKEDGRIYTPDYFNDLEEKLVGKVTEEDE